MLKKKATVSQVNVCNTTVVDHPIQHTATKDIATPPTQVWSFDICDCFWGLFQSSKRLFSQQISPGLIRCPTYQYWFQEAKVTLVADIALVELEENLRDGRSVRQGHWWSWRGRPKLSHKWYLIQYNMLYSVFIWLFCYCWVISGE